MKIEKIAELAFHENTGEAEAIAAFLALRRLKGFAKLKNILSESNPIEEHISSWTISGPDSYIGKATFVGCSFARQMDGKCHIKENKRGIFGKRKFTITLKYSTKYSPSIIEEEFNSILGV